MIYESISDTLLKISQAKKRDDKVMMIKNNHSVALQIIADACFNPDVKFLLPEGEPPYKPNAKDADSQSVLHREIRKFRIFVGIGDYENTKPAVRERQFILFLESLDPDDAKLVVAVKDKVMPFKNIDRTMFEEAWPEHTGHWALPEPLLEKEDG